MQQQQGTTSVNRVVLGWVGLFRPLVIFLLVVSRSVLAAGIFVHRPIAAVSTFSNAMLCIDCDVDGQPDLCWNERGDC